MNNVMRRRFTLREIILMVVLVAVLIVGLFFLLVYYPIRSRMNDIRIETEQVQYDTDIAEGRRQFYEFMQGEIAKIEQIPEDERTRMYAHSDEEDQWILDRLENIFAGTKPEIRYSASEQGGIYRLVINFTFSLSTAAPDNTAYDQGKRILYDLTHTGRRSQLSNLIVSPGQGNVATDDLTVSGVITFYELA